MKPRFHDTTLPAEIVASAEDSTKDEETDILQKNVD
jgi:hypothetical protein